MSLFQLAQLNIAAAKAPIDSPLMTEFVANVDRVNALADTAPGFIWRLLSDAGAEATARFPDAANALVNLTVWSDLESLQTFAFRSAHADVMRRRREWFHRLEQAYVVLWWVPAGHQPSVEEALAKLGRLRAHGATAEAFDFRTPYARPDAARAREPLVGDRERPAP